MEISFVAFVIFSTQFWSRTTVLLVSLDFLAPVECNRPTKVPVSQYHCNYEIDKKCIKIVSVFV